MDVQQNTLSSRSGVAKSRTKPWPKQHHRDAGMARDAVLFAMAARSVDLSDLVEQRDRRSTPQINLICQELALLGQTAEILHHASGARPYDDADWCTDGEPSAAKGQVSSAGARAF
jgi:hypothetical protein